MKIIPLKGWDGTDEKGRSNHESGRQPRDVAALIRQVATLPGIATKDYTGMPSMIKLFAEKCVYGDREVYVVKGIHQRWGKNPKPHIRVRFYYTMGPSLKKTAIDMHILLSEESSTWSKDNYCWKTVAITYVVGQKTISSWPGVYGVEVGNIQQEGWNRRGKFQRRLSVGCFPPPEVVPVTGGTPTATVGS